MGTITHWAKERPTHCFCRIAKEEWENILICCELYGGVGIFIDTFLFASCAEFLPMFLCFMPQIVQDVELLMRITLFN